jgi:hypothetical protein
LRAFAVDDAAPLRGCEFEVTISERPGDVVKREELAVPKGSFRPFVPLVAGGPLELEADRDDAQWEDLLKKVAKAGPKEDWPSSDL